MPTTCVIGLLWGDEGKGKIVDLLAADADYVVRYGGGHNAGHTLVHAGAKLVLHLVPSAILRDDTVNVIGSGVVVDPWHLREEIAGLVTAGHRVELGRNLLVSEGAHVILPVHRRLDGMAEALRGGAKLGTTGRGIGPAYADRAARTGIRIGDLVRPARLRDALARLIGEKNVLLQACGEPPEDLDVVQTELLALGEALRAGIVDAGRLLRDAHRAGKRILAEGAQGVLLDVDHGTYPFVTSSSASTGGVASGTGLPPQAVGDVHGVVKAYATRVGAGPFPSELSGAAAERLRAAGNEYGSTTGRPRRCGWFDTVAVRHAIGVSGTTSVILTNLDVLSGFDPLPVTVGYRLDGERLDHFPAFDVDRVEPILEELPGFDVDVTGARRYEDLPEAARRYVEFLEARIGAPITTVSVGPGRDQVIRRDGS